MWWKILLVIVGVIVAALVAAVVGAAVWGKGRSAEAVSAFEDAPPYTFPEGFLWGTATADHQIENSQNDDWTAFERAVLANKRFDSIAPGTARPGHIRNLGAYPENVVQRKTDFDGRMESDLDLARDMNANAFRFSISWARLFPTPEQTEPDPEGIAYYRRLFDALKQRRLEPVVTLFHFASPAWLWAAEGGKRGLERDDALEHFERYVRAVAESFGGDATIWCTINEPMVYAYLGHLDGVFPPNERRGDPSEVEGLLVRLLEAHALAYRVLKEDARRRGGDAKVGLTHHVRSFEPLRSWAPLDRVTARMVEEAFVWDLADAVHTGVLEVATTPIHRTIPGLKGTQDYVGINYYGRYYTRSNALAPTKFAILQRDPDAEEQVNDLGWASYPRGFYETLAEAERRYDLPIYVLESGTADQADDDVDRQLYIVDHVREMWRAIHHAEADVRGYFHWSLTDNFEWAEGFEGRFGLVAIDYQHDLRRTPRPSAKLFGEIAAANGLSEPLAKRCTSAR